MLGWWPHSRDRVGVGLFRLLLVLSGLSMAAFGLLVSLELAVHILSSRTLNSTSSLALPEWLDRLTERSEIAYPAHAALGTALETLNLSPAATAVQWFKAAAHAESDQHIEQAARGVAAALARDQHERMIPLLCTLREIGDARQVQAVRQAGLSCDRWTPSIALTTTVSAAQAISGSRVQIVSEIKSMNDVSGLVDIEVHNAEGTRLAQWVFPEEALAANESRAYTVTWEIPADLPPGEYVVKLGLFEAGWRTLHAWKNAAATVTVADASAAVTE